MSGISIISFPGLALPGAGATCTGKPAGVGSVWPGMFLVIVFLISESITRLVYKM